MLAGAPRRRADASELLELFAERCEGGAHLAGEQLRLLPRREVAALRSRLKYTRFGYAFSAQVRGAA